MAFFVTEAMKAFVKEQRKAYYEYLKMELDMAFFQQKLWEQKVKGITEQMELMEDEEEDDGCVVRELNDPIQPTP